MDGTLVKARLDDVDSDTNRSEAKKKLVLVWRELRKRKRNPTIEEIVGMILVDYLTMVKHARTTSGLADWIERRLDR